MHTSSPGATITAEGPDIQETLERERERERERECQQTETLLKKQNILMEIKHWKPQQRNKTRSSGAFFIDTQNCLCVILHHLKIPVKYLLLAINTFECG